MRVNDIIGKSHFTLCHIIVFACNAIHPTADRIAVISKLARPMKLVIFKEALDGTYEWIINYLIVPIKWVSQAKKNEISWKIFQQKIEKPVLVNTKNAQASAPVSSLDVARAHFHEKVLLAMSSCFFLSFFLFPVNAELKPRLSWQMRKIIQRVQKMRRKEKLAGHTVKLLIRLHSY